MTTDDEDGLLFLDEDLLPPDLLLLERCGGDLDRYLDEGRRGGDLDLDRDLLLCLLDEKEEEEDFLVVAS